LPRRIRINEPGFYHIINRGVEKRDVFLEKEDKDKFLKIFCKEANFYNIDLHCYVLMDNHYHLLIQTYKRNLSDFMRQVNSKYAIYFNKKYDRVGHLWQDRFKSFIVYSENYFFTLFKYFELNPLKAKITDEFGKFYRSFLYDIIHNSIIECSKNSYFLKYDLKYLLSMFDVELNKNDIEILNKIKKENRNLKKSFNIEIKKIDEFLKKEYNSKFERNKDIINAYRQGFKQSQIAEFLNLNTSTISKIIKKEKK